MTIGHISKKRQKIITEALAISIPDRRGLMAIDETVSEDYEQEQFDDAVEIADYLIDEVIDALWKCIPKNFEILRIDIHDMIVDWLTTPIKSS